MPEDTYRLIVAEYRTDDRKHESVFFGKCSEENGIITIDGRKAQMSDVNRKYNELKDKLGSQGIPSVWLKRDAALYVLKSENQKSYVIEPDDISKGHVLNNLIYAAEHPDRITQYFKSEKDEEFSEYLESISKKS